MRQTDVNFDVLVLKVKGMLPNINTDDGSVSEEWILVGSSDNFNCLGRRVETLKEYFKFDNYFSQKTMKTYEPTPSRSLDSSRGCVELLLEVINSSICLLDGRFEGSIWKNASDSTLGRCGCKILPEQRVVDVTWSIAISIFKQSYNKIVLNKPPPLNLRAAWRAMRSLGVEALA